MLQDFSLFNQVAMLQAASWIIPITTILPQSFIIDIVYFGSKFEGWIDNKIRARFDKPVTQHIYNYLRNTNNTISSVYIIGHSLDGGISEAVGVFLYGLHKSGSIINKNNKNLLNNLEIKSFSMAAPGLVWNSRKFSIAVGDLFASATLLKPRHDVVSAIDKSGGLIQSVQCHEDKIYECHLTKNTICELMSQCNAYLSNNPDLIAAFCKYVDDIGDKYMQYANYSLLD